MNPLPPFSEGSVIIQENPSPYFDRVLARGYRFVYRFECHGDLRPSLHKMRDLQVAVVYRGEQVARADFMDDGEDFTPQNIAVDPLHRRMGIGTAVYIFAEKCVGKRLSNLWGDGDQSSDSNAFWAQPNRPFGR